jgi:hypothetical protein
MSEVPRMTALRLATLTRFSAVAVLLLSVFACGSPANNSALFGGGTALAAAGSASSPSGGMSSGEAGAAGRIGGTGGTGAGATTGASGGSSAAGGVSSGGMPSGGTGDALDGGAGNPSDAGSSAGGTSAGGTSMGGTNAGGTGGALSDCTAVNANATFYPETAHCYLAVRDAATFADAKTHCANLHGHLVTLSDQAENDFVWRLDPTPHWIGATDGKGPKEPDPGTYAWVDAEPFTYTDWSTGQPNATETTCPQGTSGGGECYEHCAFQWSGGAVPGEWNDQLCQNAIDAVCEWDD